MERRGLTRREFIVGAFGLAATVGVGGLEAKPKQPDQTSSTETAIETARRRQKIHAHMVECWFAPQSDCAGKSRAAMLTELDKTMGEWIRIFKHLNKIDQALACTTTLQKYSTDDAVWSNQVGPAAELERLYTTYWNAETFSTEHENQKPINIEHADYIGFNNEAEYQKFFSDGEFVPKGWLQPVKKMIFTDKMLRTPTGDPINGQSVPTTADFLHKESTRELKLTGRTAFNGRFLLRAKLDDIYHEIAHANDWDTGHYPADLKIKTYWRVVQRMQQEKHGGTSVRTRSYQHDTASGFNRWRNAMEYWAEISSQYCENTQLADEDREIVAAVVRSTDPNYDPKQIAPRVEKKVIEISLHQLEQLVADESIIIPQPEQRSGFYDVWRQYKTKVVTNTAADTVFDVAKQREHYIEQMMQQFPTDAPGQFDRRRRIEGYVLDYPDLALKVEI